MRLDNGIIVGDLKPVDMSQILDALNLLNDNMSLSNSLLCVCVGFLFAYVIFAFVFMRRG